MSIGQETVGVSKELYFNQHAKELGEVFDIVGVPEEAKTDLNRAVNETQPWIRGDHSRPQHEFRIPTDSLESQRLHELYPLLGLRDEQLLPAGHYDHILVPGAVQRGNNRRLELLNRLVAEHGVIPSHVVLMGGQRHIFEEKEKDDIEANWATVEARGTGGPWLESLKRGTATLEWETDIMRLAAIQHLGPLAVKQWHLRLAHEDHVQRYEFEWQGVPLTLLHTLAVARKHGEARHTTEACMQDWLHTNDIPIGAKVGFIAANPHMERMGKAAHMVLLEEGRGDVQLVVAGSAGAPNLGHNIHLGEVARNLFEDQRLLKFMDPNS